MRTKLQKLLNKLDGTNERTASAISEFEGGVKTLREKLQQEISASTLEEVNLKINKLRKSIDLEPIQTSLQNLEANFSESVKSILGNIEQKTAELQDLTLRGDEKLEEQAKTLTSELSVLRETLDSLVISNRTELNLINNELGQLLESSKSLASKDELSMVSAEGVKLVEKVERKKDEELKEVKDDLGKTRIELINRMNNRGGGNMNRNIAVGGNTSVLSKYTDLNIKPGSNITLTYSNNNTTKYLDLTIAATGGSGTTRSVDSTSVSSTVGSIAGTDYVVIANAGVRITLPTASSNENLYTIKNTAASSVLVSPNGSDTIDTDTEIILQTQYTAVDLISDGVNNWNIT